MCKVDFVESINWYWLNFQTLVHTHYIVILYGDFQEDNATFNAMPDHIPLNQLSFNQLFGNKCL